MLRNLEVQFFERLNYLNKKWTFSLFILSVHRFQLVQRELILVEWMRDFSIDSHLIAFDFLLMRSADHLYSRLIVLRTGATEKEPSKNMQVLNWTIVF